MYVCKNVTHLCSFLPVAVFNKKIRIGEGKKPQVKNITRHFHTLTSTTRLFFTTKLYISLPKYYIIYDFEVL